MSRLELKKLRTKPKVHEFTTVTVTLHNITEVCAWINKTQKAEVVAELSDKRFYILIDEGEEDYETVIKCGDVLARNAIGQHFALNPYDPDDYEAIP